MAKSKGTGHGFEVDTGLDEGGGCDGVQLGLDDDARKGRQGAIATEDGGRGQGKPELGASRVLKLERLRIGREMARG